MVPEYSCKYKLLCYQRETIKKQSNYLKHRRGRRIFQDGMSEHKKRAAYFSGSCINT